MTHEQLLKNLQPPKGPVDVVLDTDTYNEIDDQYAISYLLKNGRKLTVKAFCAAPFTNDLAATPEYGMTRSHQEIIKLLKLAGREDLIPVTYEGSRTYLPDEKTPVDSPAARAIVELARQYSPEKPLYVAAIGAITNVASALLMDPSIRENIVVIWNGGNSLDWPDWVEYNLMQDVAAGRVVFGCGVPLIQLPAGGVVESFSVSGPELEHWLRGKNALCDYLVQHTVEAANTYAKGRAWTRVIWDVTSIGWLLNDNDQYMQSRIIPAPIPEYDHHCGFDFTRHPISYVWHIYRDPLMNDLLTRLGGED